MIAGTEDISLAAHHRQLEVWAENCSDIFENRAALVGAGIARIEGRVLDAEHFYEAAIRSAHATAEKAGCESPLPARHGRGISVQFAYGSYLSQVAEVEVAADGSVKVKRIVCAVDCGTYINPDTIEAQVQGGTLFGLTAALHGSITFKDGRVEQSNFDSYLPMRIDEVPVVETHLIKNAEAPGGIGEAPTAIVSAAVTNAIFAATGKRLRTLPIDTNSLKSSS